MDTPFLVIVNQNDRDISWVQKLRFPHIVMNKDPCYDNKTVQDGMQGSTKLEVKFLKFIIDSYDSLPQNIILINQYERKFYHDGSLVDLLNDPQFENKYRNSKSSGFWNFNTQLLGSMIPHVGRMMESDWWPKCMEAYFGSIVICGDFSNGKKGYSQFAVSRDRIQSLPLKFYTNMYDWLLTNTLDCEGVTYDPITLCPEYSSKWVNKIIGSGLGHSWDHPNSSYHISKYMELSWEFIFTSWKPHENIDIILSNGKSIFALYGYGSYYRNVTSHIITNFLDQKHGTVMIPYHVNFNDLFGDVTPGCVKTLRLILDGKMTEINESRTITV